MTGKYTARDGLHGTRSGMLIKPIAMTNQDWTRLELILERPITDAQKASIAEGLSGFASMREEYESDDLSTQDVKATLKKIAGLPDEDVHLAVSHCDTWTEERLTHALWRMGEKQDWSSRGHPPAKWKAAALLALAEFPKSVSGPKEKWYRPPFARYALGVWEAMGQTDVSIWELDGDASPLVVFVTCLLALIETETVLGPPGYSTVAKLLRKVAA